MPLTNDNSVKSWSNAISNTQKTTKTTKNEENKRTLKERISLDNGFRVGKRNLV